MLRTYFAPKMSQNVCTFSKYYCLIHSARRRYIPNLSSNSLLSYFLSSFRSQRKNTMWIPSPDHTVLYMFIKRKHVKMLEDNYSALDLANFFDSSPPGIYASHHVLEEQYFKRLSWPTVVADFWLAWSLEGYGMKEGQRSTVCGLDDVHYSSWRKKKMCPCLLGNVKGEASSWRKSFSAWKMFPSRSSFFSSN